MIPDTFLKQLLFSTVRIVADVDIDDSTKKSVGTGFLVNKKIDEQTNQVFLITNKHVIASTDQNGKVIGKFKAASFSLLKKESDLPKLGDRIVVNVTNLSDLFFLHPDESVDLAICNISDLFNVLEKSKQSVFIRSIPLELIPSKEEMFDVIEDIVFVGYPNGVFDESNHLPIMRRGITASPIEIDFEGSKKFIIDAQVFPGSSGSPVFIKEQHLRNGNLKIGADNYYFVGIISRVFHRTEEGDLIESIAPTAPSSSTFSVRQMIGLGICEKASQIPELIELYAKQQAKS